MTCASMRTSRFWSSFMLMIRGMAADFSRCTSVAVGVDPGRLGGARSGFARVVVRGFPGDVAQRGFDRRPVLSCMADSLSRLLMLASWASLNSAPLSLRARGAGRRSGAATTRGLCLGSLSEFGS